MSADRGNGDIRDTHLSCNILPGFRVRIQDISLFRFSAVRIPPRSVRDGIRVFRFRILSYRLRRSNGAVEVPL